MRVLLLTPPMTQLNTPYPATAFLTGFLRQLGHDVRQADPALELVLRLVSRGGLEALRAELIRRGDGRGRPAPSVASFLAQSERYLGTVDAAVRFLQGKDQTLATRIASGAFLPEGPRFRALEQFAPPGSHEDPEAGDPLAWAFGALGVQDRAKYFASLYLDDLIDAYRDGVDPRFELSRYGEKLAASAASFEPLRAALTGEPTLVDRTLDEITAELVAEHRPTVLGLTVPFPGNVYGALRIAQTVRRLSPATKIVLGGGWVNTELRSLAEPRLFDFVDFVTLDDGERPFALLLEHIAGRRGEEALLRTYVRSGGAVVLRSGATERDVPLAEQGTPTYDGLPLAKYLSIAEMLNPMHRIWSDGRWNKLLLAHGCYWRKCNFCDVSLDYIGRYEEQTADLVVDRIERLVAETGQTGFHFVDEAAPPKMLLALAKRLVERKVAISWWGNVRFEKTFTPEVARKLAESGLIAVSGGLEVASDRLLKLMSKGVTVEQVARVTRAFTDAGVLVHAYLMYGFPTQTEDETVESLERVRQLFAEGCIQSAFWHRFSATIHSPIGKDPAKFGIRIVRGAATGGARAPLFAQNDLEFVDPTGVDHDRLGAALRKATYNFMHGVGLDSDVRFWFDHHVKKPRVSKRLVEDALTRSGGREGSTLQ
jgi:radical SAM superfamily enzyme YgiQ (UPF0313 family)